MWTTCCICFKQLSNNDHRDIFDENLLINSQENNLNEKSDEYIKLQDAIELIIDSKISKIDNAALCKMCFQKIESYIKFRSQLVQSLQTLNNIEASNSDSSSFSRNEENIKTSQIVKTSNRELQIPTKEIINVDEDVPSNFNHLSYIKSENNDFLSFPKSPNSEENDNLNDSDSSNDNTNNHISLECLSKVQENDIESEIDVCSGEDDEVLELDIQCKQNETVDISSSSESDVEVCDYGPTAKKMKHYVISSPTIF